MGLGGLLLAKSSLRWPRVASRRRAWPAKPPPPACWGGWRLLGGLTGVSPLPQVVCVFRMESAAPKTSAGEGEEAESNSVESLGFCNV